MVKARSYASVIVNEVPKTFQSRLAAPAIVYCNAVAVPATDQELLGVFTIVQSPMLRDIISQSCSIATAAAGEFPVESKLAA